MKDKTKKNILILFLLLVFPLTAFSQSNHGTGGGTAGGNCPDVDAAVRELMDILNKYYPKKRAIPEPEYQTVKLKDGKEVSIPKLVPPMSQEHKFAPRFETREDTITHILNLTFQIQLSELEQLNEEKLRKLCGDEKVDEVLKNHPWLKTEPRIYKLLEDINDFAYNKAGNPCGATWDPFQLKQSIQFLKIWFEVEELENQTPQEKKLKEVEEYHKSEQLNINGRSFQG